MASIMLQTKPESAGTVADSAGSLRSVLLHVQEDDGLQARLQTALAIVRASGGHLTCLQVESFSAYADFAFAGATIATTQMISALNEQAAATRTKLEAELENEDVVWSLEEVRDHPVPAIVAAGALADLIVVGRYSHDKVAAYPALSVFGGILRSTRTPILVCPNNTDRFDPFGPAIVAWNGSFEAANALRAALPILRQASSVHVVTVDEDRTYDLPPLGAAEYLSRHGIPTEYLRENSGTLSVSERLVATAKSLGAAYLVMGAYSHARLREFLFGGVTRHLLQECDLPLLVAR